MEKTIIENSEPKTFQNENLKSKLAILKKQTVLLLHIYGAVNQVFMRQDVPTV